MRTCKICQRELPITLFGDGRRWQCNSCRVKKRDRNKKNEIHRRWKLKKFYGITPERYDAMLREQGGVCAICGNPDPNKALSVDHDHNSGQIRKLLCSSCNWAIGHAKEDVEVLKKCIEYLESFKEVPKP